MIADRDLKIWTQQLLRISSRRPDQPGDEAMSDEEWEAQATRCMERAFRSGARAQMNRSSALDPVDKVRWLSEQGFGDDLRALLAEVDRARDQAKAFAGTYGVTEDDIRSTLGEGFHTAFRKATDSPQGVVIHQLIRDLDNEEWEACVGFVAEPLISMLRRAEQAVKGKAGEQAVKGKAGEQAVKGKAGEQVP